MLLFSETIAGDIVEQFNLVTILFLAARYKIPCRDENLYLFNIIYPTSECFVAGLIARPKM